MSHGECISDASVEASACSTTPLASLTITQAQIKPQARFKFADTLGAGLSCRGAQTTTEQRTNGPRNPGKCTSAQVEEWSSNNAPAESQEEEDMARCIQ